MRCRYLPVAIGKSVCIEQYPNFSASGSIRGMRKLYYGKDALLVRCGSYIYKVSENIYYMAHFMERMARHMI